MELDKVMEERRSIRKFKPDPVPDELILKLLEAARLAPSGSNIQPWRFLSVRSPEMKEKIKSATRYTFVAKAPVILVCCADLAALETRTARIDELMQSGVFDGVEVDGTYAPPEKTSEQMLSYLTLNVGIAITHIMLKAVDLGLGACWIGGFDSQKVKSMLGLKENLFVAALLPIGFPDGIPKSRPRIPLDQIRIDSPE